MQAEMTVEAMLQTLFEVQNKLFRDEWECILETEMEKELFADAPELTASDIEAA